MQRPIRMNQHLGETLHTLVELLIGIRRIINIDLVRYNKRWLSSSRYDKVPQIAIICLDIALTRSK
jgi:hypothetical protein